MWPANLSLLCIGIYNSCNLLLPVFYNLFYLLHRLCFKCLIRLSSSSVFGQDCICHFTNRGCWSEEACWFFNAKVSCHTHIHCVLKLAAPLLRACLIQFVVHGFQRNIVHSLHYLNIAYSHTHYDVRTLLCVLSVMSLWRQSLFTSVLRSIHGYWQGSSSSVPALD